VNGNRSLQCTSLAILGFILPVVFATGFSQNAKEKKPPVPGPMLEQGIVNYETPEFTLSLVLSSQTVAALKPKGSDGFDFTPGDLLVARSQNGYFHLGDITLRLRAQDSGKWANYSTASMRSPVTAMPPSGDVLAGADLAPTLSKDIPLRITRTWSIEDGKLTLRFLLKNKSDGPVQIGALGIPMIFNNVLNDRTLEQAHAICSFYDPYIGEDAGYLQVTVPCYLSFQTARRRLKPITQYLIAREPGVHNLSSLIQPREALLSKAFTNGWCTVRPTLKMNGVTLNLGILRLNSR